MCNIPKVSVVIPVYNTAPYLHQCLDSVLNQTLREIELICVDDGSADGSAAILKEYASKSPVSRTSINILTQENAGQSVARNVGTAHARGEYIYYLDSDDALHPHALERLYQVAEALRLDVLFFDAEVLYEKDTLREQFQHAEGYYHNLAQIAAPCTGAELLTQLSEKRMYRVSPCLQFSRAEFLRENRITFYPGIIHEDNLYTFTCILLAKRAFKLDEVFYYRRMRPASTMTKPPDFHNVYGSLRCLIEMLALCHTMQDSCALAISADAVNSALGSLQGCLQRYYSQLDEDERKKLQQLTPVEQFYLRFFAQQTTLQSQNRQLKQTLASRERALKSCRSEIDAIHSSFTYRIGRVITWLPRMLRKILRKTHCTPVDT